MAAIHKEVRGDRTVTYSCESEWATPIELVWSVCVADAGTERLAAGEAARAAGQPPAQDLLEDDTLVRKGRTQVSRDAAEWLRDEGCPPDECVRLVRESTVSPSLSTVTRLAARGVQPGETPMTAGLAMLAEETGTSPVRPIL